MTPPAEDIIWITEDPNSGYALLTGRSPSSIRRLARFVDADPIWSSTGNGHVIVRTKLADFIALCQWQGIPTRVRERGRS